MASISQLRIASFLSLCNNSRILLPSLRSINHLKKKSPSSGSVKCRPIKCMAAGTETPEQTQVVRRSGNYEPSIWNYNYIQSLKSDYLGESCTKQLDHLKKEVRAMLDQEADPSSQLELIDILQRLGVFYHFEVEIERILGNIYNNFDDKKKKDLHTAALEFRLLRQQGHNVAQEIFNGFMDESGPNFKACLSTDTKGILSLYEASYLLMEGESILEKARYFTTQHLQDYVNKHKNKNNLLTLVSHALEFPLHWRPQRVESRWFIDHYDKRHDKIHVLLQFAKLDYNMVQAVHQEDLKDKSRWWNNLGLAKKLPFSRDRLMENFLWTTAFLHESQFSYFRSVCTEIYVLITTVDDVYDIYGTLDELKLFTQAIERWDINSLGQLPEYMRLCFFAVYNSANKLAYDVLNKHGIDVIYYLKKSWLDLVKAYTKEAEWYYSGYKPSLEEYLENSWIAIGVPLVLVQDYFGVANSITKEALEGIENYHDLIRCSAVILRLEDDIGTSSHELARGDVPKALQCYMRESGGSEEDARKHVRKLIGTTWDKMNKAAAGCPFPKDYIRVALNIARMSHHMYQYGDGHASQNKASQDRILSLLIQPIPLTSRDANV
uniref:Terpene synthase n=1 Tax=Pelargonium graveolens TaxID=73200 RepID=A0A2S1JKZ8_9ROSI|nr:terpene synthase [Pelargonium graveolens]